MRSLVLDELMPDALEDLRGYLDRTLQRSKLPDVYWLRLPDDLLSQEQTAHSADCGPHQVAVVLEADSLRLELLVRGHGTMRCSCFAYASRAQRDFLLSFLDRLIDELDLAT